MLIFQNHFFAENNFKLLIGTVTQTYCCQYLRAMGMLFKLWRCTVAKQGWRAREPWMLSDRFAAAITVE